MTPTVSAQTPLTKTAFEPEIAPPPLQPPTALSLLDPTPTVKVAAAAGWPRTARARAVKMNTAATFAAPAHRFVAVAKTFRVASGFMGSF